MFKFIKNLFKKIGHYLNESARKSEITEVKHRYAILFSFAPNPSFELLKELQRLENEEINKINEKYGHP